MSNQIKEGSIVRPVDGDMPKQAFLDWGIMLVVFTSAIATRIYRIEEVNVWLDEAWIFNGLFEPASEALNPFNISGVFNWFTYSLSQLVNMYDETNLRSVSIVFGALACVLVYRLSLDLMAKLYASLVALLVVVSPLLITYSQEYSVYAFCSFWATLQFYIFVKWTKDFNYRLAAIFGLVSFIGINTRPQLAFFTFVLVLGALAQGALVSSKKLKSIALAGLFMLPAGYAFIKAFLLNNLLNGSSSATFEIEVIGKVYKLVMTALLNLPSSDSFYSPNSDFAFYNDNPMPFRYLFGVLFCSALGYFIVRKKGVMVILGCAIAFFVVMTSVGMIYSNQFCERYVLFLQPLTVMFLLFFFADISRQVKSLHLLSVSFILLLAGYWAQTSYQSSYDVRWKPHNRAAFEQIKLRLSGAKRSYVVVPYFYEWPIANYYLKGNKHVTLMEKSFEFYAEFERGLSMTGEEHTELALAQVTGVKKAKPEQIFVYTQRGKFSLQNIETMLTDEYAASLIYETPSIVVVYYQLKKSGWLIVG